MYAYVVSLTRRPDRLADFTAHATTTGLSSLFRFVPFEAVDGSTLDLDTLRPRVRKSSLENMDHRRLVGNLGCTLSHVELWRRIAEADEPVAVFEDDARLSDGIDAEMVAEALRRRPANADLIWLNDYYYWARAGVRVKVRRKLTRAFGSRLLGPRRVTFSRMPDALTTTEAYIVSPTFARRLYHGIKDDLGAVDRHMQLFVAENGGRVYQTDPPLFGQRDRGDTDTGTGGGRPTPIHAGHADLRSLSADLR